MNLIGGAKKLRKKAVYQFSDDIKPRATYQLYAGVVLHIFPSCEKKKQRKALNILTIVMFKID